MGVFRQRMSVRNPQTGRSIELEALIDTGSTSTALSLADMTRLGVAALGTRSFELANKHLVDLSVGYVEVVVEGRSVVTLGAFGEEVAEPILGATALELLFLAVDRVLKALVPVHGLLM